MAEKKQCPLCGGKIVLEYCDSCGFRVPDEQDINALYDLDPNTISSEMKKSWEENNTAEAASDEKFANLAKTPSISLSKQPDIKPTPNYAPNQNVAPSYNAAPNQNVAPNYNAAPNQNYAPPPMVAPQNPYEMGSVAPPPITNNAFDPPRYNNNSNRPSAPVNMSGSNSGYANYRANNPNAANTHTPYNAQNQQNANGQSPYNMNSKPDYNRYPTESGNFFKDAWWKIMITIFFWPAGIFFAVWYYQNAGLNPNYKSYCGGMVITTIICALFSSFNMVLPLMLFSNSVSETIETSVITMLL